MKKTNCRQQFIKTNYISSFPSRLIWRETEKGPEKISQKEFHEIGELVKQLEEEKNDLSTRKNEIVQKIYDKLVGENQHLFSPELLRTLAGNKEAKIREGVAKNKSTPKDVLARLIMDPEPSVKMGALLNPSISKEVIQKVIKESEINFRIELAKSSQTTPRVLELLLQDPDPEVKANNRFTPANELRKMAYLRNYKIISAVAKNPSTPIDTLVELASDVEKERRGHRHVMRRMLQGEDLIELKKRLANMGIIITDEPDKS